MNVLLFGSANATPLPSQVNHELKVLSPYQKAIQEKLDTNSTVIQKISLLLQAEKLPSVLVLIPMLESSYNPKAISHANAAGLWQLIPTTAVRFGLQVSEVEDQRFDVTESTIAAIKYLVFLHNKFDNLALTIAAYNAGEGRVARAINRAGSRNYSDLILPEETTQYVNRFYALIRLVEIDHLTKQSSQQLFLFSKPSVTPLIDLKPLPPLIML